MQLVSRPQVSRRVLALAPVAAVLVTLLASAPLIAVTGAPVLRAYAELFAGAFGGMLAITETLTRATPLILTGLAAAVAFRAHFYNIGAEGQLYIGAVAAVLVGGMHGGSGLALPVWVLFPAMLFAGALAGALLLLGPAVLKTRFGVDEVVTTLLLNFVMVLFVSMLLDGALKDPMGLGWPQSRKVIAEAQLPRLIQGKRLHLGFLIAIGAALIVWFINARTTFGYEMRAVGFNPRAARFAGIPVNWVMAKTALLSGGLAALAGVSEVAGLKGNLTLDLSPGFGYTGIVVAMLAVLHPIGVIAAAIFVAAMFVGADAMSRTVGVPNYIANVMVATALLTMVTAMLFTRFRLKWR
jgi:simple sugar transport system permease protein